MQGGKAQVQGVVAIGHAIKIKKKKHANKLSTRE